jgi:hypothetical protein
VLAAEQRTCLFRLRLPSSGTLSKAFDRQMRRVGWGWDAEKLVDRLPPARAALLNPGLSLQAFRLSGVARHAKRAVSRHCLLEHLGGTLVVAGATAIQQQPGV